MAEIYPKQKGRGGGVYPLYEYNYISPYALPAQYGDNNNAYSAVDCLERKRKMIAIVHCRRGSTTGVLNNLTIFKIFKKRFFNS